MKNHLIRLVSHLNGSRSHCGRQWKNNPWSYSEVNRATPPITCPEYMPAGRVNSKESCLSLWDLGLCCRVLPHTVLCSLHPALCSWLPQLQLPWALVWYHGGHPLWRTQAANFGRIHKSPPSSPTISVSVQSVRAVGIWLCPPTF